MDSYHLTVEHISSMGSQGHSQMAKLNKKQSIALGDLNKSSKLRTGTFLKRRQCP